jgi:restriction endonuclease S subunit
MRNLAKHLSDTSGKPYEDILLNHCYGCEIETKAYRSLQFNIVMETGDISGNVYNANSLKYLMYGKVANDQQTVDICEYNTEKRYDYIFANPPFGCKTELEMIQRDANDKVNKKTKAIGNYKMKTKNSDGMFLQLIIDLLKDGGEACIVMCGSIFNKDWIPLRKHWIETCEIKSITVCPKDSFKNTSIESYLIHFKKGGKTERINYCYFDGTIIGHRQDFDESYVIDVPRLTVNIVVASDMTCLKLGDLCDIQSGNFQTSDMSNTGDIPFYTSSAINPTGTHNKYTFDYPEYVLIVTAGGVQNDPCGKHGMGRVYLARGKTACRSTVKSLKVKDEYKDKIQTPYLFYYLQHIRKTINEEAKFTTNLGVIPLDAFKNINVVFPATDQQAITVNDLQKLDHNIHITKQKIEADKEYMKILLETETMGCEKVRLGDVCDVKSGKAIAKGKLPEGDVPIWGGGVKPMGCTEKHTHTIGTIVISKDGANAGYVHRLKADAFLTGSANFITDIKQATTVEYLYFELKYHKQGSLTDLQGNPTAQPHVYPDQIKSIEIGLPSLDKQQEVVTECLRIYAQIAGNEMTLANCDKQKQKLIVSDILG